jgi:GTP-binding protein
MFKLAVIGRPNVGKSTLFNFLIGKNIALTSPVPGLTRDRKEAIGSLFDLSFSLFDTGGYDDLSEDMNYKIWEQALKSIEEADCVLFVVDGHAGLSPVDEYLASILRKINKPVVLCVNKIDTKQSRSNLPVFYEMGFKSVVNISSAHGLGMEELYDAVKQHYIKTDDVLSTLSGKPELMISFVGKPNVGKSTLINNILNEERLIASEIAGTTRDAIYLDFLYNDKKVKIVDTAGLRRRSKVERGTVEKLINYDSIHAIDFSNVVVLVISAEDGLTKQDLTIAKYVVDQGRGLMVVVNKIDLVKDKKAFLKSISHSIEDAFFQIKKPYILSVSALKDNDLRVILDTAFELYGKWQIEIKTSLLNAWLKEVLLRNQPPTVKGRRVKIKYISSVKTRPPTINIWSNFDTNFPTSYLRFLQNELYEDFNLWGCTIRLNIHKSDNPYESKKKS